LEESKVVELSALEKAIEKSIGGQIINDTETRLEYQT